MAHPEMAVAEEAARAAGAVLTRYFREGVAMRSKATANLVSDADVEAERAVVEVIRRSFPGHEVLGEEAHSGDAGAEHLWVVDPLDGTANFAHKIPQFAVSVAYYRAGVPQCGVVYNPVHETWHTAVLGGGAFLDGRKVAVGDEASLSEVLVGVGFYYDRGAIMEATLGVVGELKRDHHIHGIRRFGAASLDLCMVGLGQYGAYFELELSPWDFAAGRLFVEEAGGRVTTCEGGPLPLAKSSVLASNGHVHGVMVEVIARRAAPPA
jgi:myo-inositol-1(or 4)-monophosphatase